MSNWVVGCVAIVCVAVVECVALIKGFDGTILALALTVIGGVAGYNIKKPERR